MHLCGWRVSSGETPSTSRVEFEILVNGQVETTHFEIPMELSDACELIEDYQVYLRKMMMTDWDCPEDLIVGDIIEVDYSGIPLGEGTVTQISGSYVKLNLDGLDFYITYHQRGAYKWRRFGVPTIQTFKAAPPVYGAVCSKCGDYNEFAEVKEGFRCGPCRSWE